MDLISTIIPAIKSGNKEQFCTALADFRKPKECNAVKFAGIKIAEYDRDNCHVAIYINNGVSFIRIWEKKEHGNIAHVIVHNAIAEYTFDKIPF